MKEPGTLRKDPVYAEMKIDKWQISVLTAPSRRDIPKQKIKIEVANVPAHTKEAMPLRVNYSFLPGNYGETLIFTETLNEVMADKLISLPATQNYIRYRDVWDIPWLVQQGAQLDMGLVKKKVADYRLDDFDSRLDKLVKTLPEILTTGNFQNEMRRFLPMDVYERTLGKEKFDNYLATTLNKLFRNVREGLSGKSGSHEFVM